ncbi:MAG: transketolase C-terminal domain-containing protein [Pseudomonadota bacterium]|nr:transketolase C-terminal domain-containing protein [Pseudomonadota bacterium]
MRDKFADVIFEEGKKNDKICALVADISPAGSMMEFRKKFPNRFINCGVAEQAMIGIAAGLALKGMRPFCYTIATFSLFRPFEMVRVDLCYQNLPVTVIGMGAGVIYSTLGSTHHTMEDISVASSIPNMTVLAPCDPEEMKLATRWCAIRSKGPVYMRLGKRGEPVFTKNSVDKFQIGKIRYLKKGKDIAIITYGITISLANKLSKRLNQLGKSVSVISCHTLKPIDIKGISKMLKRHTKTIVIEEHVPNGGLSSRIKEIAFTNKINADVKFFTLKDKFIHFYGSYEQLLDKHGISFNKILKNIK